MKITNIVVSMFETNCYLIYDEISKECAIIDPGAEAERIIAQIEKSQLIPRVLLLTHGHGDHCGAVGDILEKYDIPFYAGQGEEALLLNAELNMSAAIGIPVVCPEPTKLLTDTDTVSFGGITFSVIQTPGHSPGGVCYLSEKHLICGDTLFYGSIGRTDFPGCSTEKLVESIVNKLLCLPEDTICYPGHGPETTIGFEKSNNPFLTGGHFV
ncbi:MAG: MBL fold metallo-hydrolase [candidate division Zixibacteria bacterium]|nr:MBL fold metallo-hydrolase [candidate division Zixibacteria bacterium]